MSQPDALVSSPDGNLRRRPAEPVRTAAEARSRLAALLATVDGGSPATVEDAKLAVTELVINAQSHGGGMTRFDARLDPEQDALVVEVEDANDGRPEGETLDRRDLAAPGGRGWAMVQLLATTCAVESLPGGGKRIRVTFLLRPGSPAES
ncbi:ATP-binding protein [Kitasatospora sp. NPDC006697]|uniref:ATP-binding protein n=1 Tax=Kitasatospora sp. NPDC006697 TaxID=3364020 RepID=UPI0036AF62BA